MKTHGCNSGHSSMLSYYYYTTYIHDIYGHGKPFQDMFVYFSINSK